jgi:arginine decarboxylase
MELKALCDDINSKNYREYYHDALDHKDELHTQFNLGLISLEDRAKGEVLFWEVCARASRFARVAKVQEEEFDDLKKILASKYLCNFSVFRSVPDAWAIEQLFPIMPIHKLNQQPTDYATLADLTCDSDGTIAKFVDLKDVKEVLEIHPLNGDPYYIAILLIGAYQEVMGSFHNLFGLPNEAHVVIGDDGRYHIKKIVSGSRINDMITYARYDKNVAWESFRRMAMARALTGHMLEEEAHMAVEEYEDSIGRYTYLE